MDVVDAMDYVCDLPKDSQPDTPLKIDFPIKGRPYSVDVMPGHMQLLCRVYSDDWVDELTELFIRREPNESEFDLHNQFCGGSYFGNEGIN